MSKFYKLLESYNPTPADRIKWKKVGIGRWESSDGEYTLWELEEPTPDGNYGLSYNVNNQYLGTGSKKSLDHQANEHKLFG